MYLRSELQNPKKDSKVEKYVYKTTNETNKDFKVQSKSVLVYQTCPKSMQQTTQNKK